jgi:hypothetical protein
MKTKTKREMPLSDALEEIATIARESMGEGSARVDGKEIKLGDPVTLEIESESGKKGGELEIEIKWPTKKAMGEQEESKGGGKGRLMLFLALLGIAAGAAAVIFSRRMRGSPDDGDWTDDALTPSAPAIEQ